MDPPELSVVIPTRDRHASVERAVESALCQTFPGIEVVVVDDGSARPVALAPRPRLRCIRRATSGGPSAARNTGLEAARGRWITFLDDDNRLLPHMASVSLRALDRTDLPPPVAVISGVEVVSTGDRVVERRVPPTHARGDHFSLEPALPGRSHMTKATLVVERGVLRGIGGFDESFPTRELSDLFLRLNPVCSVLGLPTVTYRVTREPAVRLSRNGALLEEGVKLLIRKHRRLLEAHPKGHADVLLGHARMSLVAGPRRAVVPSVARAFRLAPRHTSRVLLSPRRMGRALVHLNSSG